MLDSNLILHALKGVVDPEIGVNVVDLNLIKAVDINDKRIIIKMVLTSPFCPLISYLVNEVKRKTQEVAEGRDVEVVVLDEPWVPPERFRSEGNINY